MAPTRAAQLRKGVLELAILALLDSTESYGGEIVATLAETPGLEASAGTVYPLLTRLRTAKLVETTWVESPSGPPRKYYSLTPAGRAELAAGAQAWRQLAHALDTLLEER